MSIVIYNPANPSEEVSKYDSMTPDMIPNIMKQARIAQQEWAKVPSIQRGIIVGKFLDTLESHSEEIATSITREMGKLIGEARGEVAKSLGEGRQCIARAGAPIGEVLPTGKPNTRTYTMRRPRGVIAGICPWNFPFGTPIRKTIPALVYGNAIVLKPSTFTPGAVKIMCDVAKDFFPNGLVQFIVGENGIGSALSSCPDIDGLSFTGSVEVGKLVAKSAAENLVEVSLELGGKNPAILNDASDLDAALNQIYTAFISVSGQRCTSVSRVIVNEKIAKDVINGLVERANAAVLGDGMADSTTMAPLMNQDQLDTTAGFVERAVTAGATIAAGGGRVNTPTQGYFYRPTILTNLTPDMEVATDEVFGPVLSVLTYKTVEEAMAIANGVNYGLTSCLFTEDASIIDTFIAESESGMLHINIGSFPDDHMPFVGLKDSSLGVGGSNGASTIQFYTSEHAVYVKGKV